MASGGIVLVPQGWPRRSSRVFARLRAMNWERVAGDVVITFVVRRRRVFRSGSCEHFCEGRAIPAAAG
jgi:hypothetical protein